MVTAGHAYPSQRSSSYSNRDFAFIHFPKTAGKSLTK